MLKPRAIFPRWNLLRYRVFRITFIALPKREIRAELNSIQFHIPASLFWVTILSFGHFKVLNSIPFIKKLICFSGSSKHLYEDQNSMIRGRKDENRDFNESIALVHQSESYPYTKAQYQCFSANNLSRLS